MISAPEQLSLSSGDEWVVAIATLPSPVTENGKTFQPSLIIWMDAASEMIIGTELVPPADALDSALAHLRRTARPAGGGRAALPGRIRAASPALAGALQRASLDGIDIVCGPTPELDRALDSLLEQFGANRQGLDLHYLGGDASADDVAAMFRAAAGLYTRKPWEAVPSDSCLIGITSDALGLRDAVVSVIGQAGQVFGFALFANLDDFDRFGEASDRRENGLAGLPGHVTLTYNRRADAGPALRAEIAAHRWLVAGARALPTLIAVDDGGTARNPSRREMLRVEAIAALLADILGARAAELEAAFNGGAPLQLSTVLQTSGGDVDLQLSAPAPGTELEGGMLDEQGDLDLDDDRVAAYRNDILTRFAASPEAQAEPGAHWSEFLVDYAASHFGKTAMSLEPSELRALVFELIPRKVSVEPTAAPEIIAGLRAFFAFLHRELPTSRADRLLAVLDATASQRLARLLADRASYGPAKAFVMSGRAAGFDMSTQAGIDAWATHMRNNDLRLPTGFARPAPSRLAAPPAPTRRAKKTKRKAQRAARNKSRSRR